MTRLTKIICTLGPVSNDESGIRMLARGGMNIARMNFSHGTADTHREVVERVRAVNKKEGLHVGILLDTKGAEIRTGDRSEPLTLSEGDLAAFSHKGKTDGKLPVITVSYPAFAKDAKDARFILIDSGEAIFDIVRIERDCVTARARGNATIGSRRHVNLPGADVTLPSLAEKDWEDIRLACKLKLDYIALSFIRNGKEVNEVRAFTKRHGHPDILLISKIENAIAVKNIDGIIEASDGVMIARGDLGAEIPLETLPRTQDDITLRCRKAGKPVIMATQMLESMMKNPMPTRAEVTDVAHAVMIGVDSTMLSGETAAGKHPVEALSMMDRIIVETERNIPYVVHSPMENGNAAAAVSMAEAEEAAAILVFTRTGVTARAVSMLRPRMPVYAACADEDVLRRLQLFYGIIPLLLPTKKTKSLPLLKKRGIVRKGDCVVEINCEKDVCNVYTVTI